MPLAASVPPHGHGSTSLSRSTPIHSLTPGPSPPGNEGVTGRDGRSRSPLSESPLHPCEKREGSRPNPAADGKSKRARREHRRAGCAATIKPGVRSTRGLLLLCLAQRAPAPVRNHEPFAAGDITSLCLGRLRESRELYSARPVLILDQYLNGAACRPTRMAGMGCVTAFGGGVRWALGTIAAKRLPLLFSRWMIRSSQILSRARFHSCAVPFVQLLRKEPPTPSSRNGGGFFVSAAKEESFRRTRRPLSCSRTSGLSGPSGLWEAGRSRASRRVGP